MTFTINMIHSSAFRQATFPVTVPAVRRAHGALRYRCPSTGSYVLLTDPAALAEASTPQAPVHCPGCGDTHLLAQDTRRTEIVRPRTSA
jgi:hypothetical protein